MTSAARPTFHPAVGGEDIGYYRMEAGTRQLSVKDMPGHTRLKFRRTQAQKSQDELKAELEQRELKVLMSKNTSKASSQAPSEMGDSKNAEAPAIEDVDEERDADDIVAGDVDSDDSSDDEDETMELMRELERIKKEREEDAARKEAEEKARREKEQQDMLLRGNPLLAGSSSAGSFAVKRRWDDDIIFRNQARNEPMSKKVLLLSTFINDTIRNDFHKKFLNKYIK
ncbi:hypothetical protein GUITHDRAFT_132490 [Guillardia theta CCMP2712]|uniref:Cwf15/Cwc15 cell cycle control protein n=1 Tax=Guillardia theta (strain CCMP2712) TaxID=905079 RepID=L1JZQ5_GUITC|nr:hypothetical protein GUITHDRAFT_132490 [Guillardia theta CCMP2712]EKX54086.1 hypothetical protein GUITHDRAFT_132490 [Guillardia theta CCMP2712]|eukprot:XP_005841066.1 hypothetical protein GUITHDRAFT_132490 [Guillardia theta CCMP2712]